MNVNCTWYRVRTYLVEDCCPTNFHIRELVNNLNFKRQFLSSLPWSHTSYAKHRGHSRRTDSVLNMADPFEVRMRFTSHLQHLNASTTSATKTANYALKYSEFSDDLHSCILEQLERSNMNNRANIMYFLPALCETAKSQNELGYVRMMERDILRIIDLVAPDDGSGAANVKVVRKVLSQLRVKGFLREQTVVELEECIVGRDLMGDLASSPLPAAAGEERTAAATATTSTATTTTEQEGGAVQAAARLTPHSTSREQVLAYTPAIRVDKRQIEQRIEEDRERHKKAREGIWAVSQEAGKLADDAEFEKMWEEVSDVGDDDYQLAKEEVEERRKYLEFEGT
nr:ctd kinase subunit gamma [Quercus suber]